MDGRRSPTLEHSLPHCDPRSNLGNCLKLLGQPAVAEAHYRQALAADPNFADAHSNLGNLLAGAGRPGGRALGVTVWRTSRCDGVVWKDATVFFPGYFSPGNDNLWHLDCPRNGSGSEFPPTSPVIRYLFCPLLSLCGIIKEKGCQFYNFLDGD